MNLNPAQTANFAAALAVAPDRATAERLAFAIWSESGGHNYANSGLNTSHSPGVTPTIAAKLRESLSIPHDAVGSNGRSTGILQQTSSDVGGAWGDMAGTMTPAVAAQRFLNALTVTDNPVYRGKNQTPSGQLVSVDVTLTAVAADVLRVQQPLISEQQSGNYDAAQVAIAQQIAAQFAAPADWITMASEQDVANAVAAAVAASALAEQVSEIQQRLRGVDTAVGQEHHDWDMLQGINAALKALAADVSEIKERVRGGDTATGQKHEHYDMLQGIDSQTEHH